MKLKLKILAEPHDFSEQIWILSHHRIALLNCINKLLDRIDELEKENIALKMMIRKELRNDYKK